MDIEAPAAARWAWRAAVAMLVYAACVGLPASTGHAATSRERLTIHERLLDFTRRGKAQRLLVDCQAVLDTPGTYAVTAAIENGGDHGWTLLESTNAGIFWGPPATVERGTPRGIRDGLVQADSHGRVRFMVEFAGKSLRMSERDGPWQLAVYLTPARRQGTTGDSTAIGARVGHVLRQTTRTWRREQFAGWYPSQPWEDEPIRLPGVPSNALRVLVDGFDLVVATAAVDTPGTNGAPPVSHLRVDERLWGRRTPDSLVVRLDFTPEDFAFGCGVRSREEIAEERRWAATQLPALPAGSRWILAVRPTGGPVWRSWSTLRWPYDDSLHTQLRRQVRGWPVAARELTRIGRLNALQAKRRQREGEQTRERERERATAAWLAREQTIAESADLVGLASTSSDVVVGELSMEAYPLVRHVRLDVRGWLRCAGDTVNAHTLSLFVGEREDSVVQRWEQLPSAAGATRAARHRPVRCIAFLRFAHRPIPHVAPDSAYRIVDPVAGLLLATPGMIARTRSVLAAHSHEAIAPRSGCGASLAGFAGIDDAHASRVGLKLSRLGSARVGILNGAALVLSVGDAWDIGSPDRGADGFAPCALPDDHYERDYIGSSSFLMPAALMRALVDSLVALGPALSDHVDPADTLSLMLRRSDGGSERVFECTLDAARFLTVARILSNLFPPPETLDMHHPAASSAELARMNVAMWTSLVDRRCATLWNPRGAPPPR